jgi:uncharacterized OB-fold protein
VIRADRVCIPFRYAAGVTASRFLAALRDEGRILGACCPGCARVVCPARSICPLCGEATGDLVEVGPHATLVSWTESLGRDSCPGSEEPAKGISLGLLRLDGADTCMLHRLLGPGPFDAGMTVRARFASHRTGSILDLEGFEPERGEP